MRAAYAILALGLLGAARESLYEVRVERGPAIDAGPNTFWPDKEVPDGTPLESFLGGKTNIAKILVSTPFANTNQQTLTAELVRERVKTAKKSNEKKREWHFAPFTMGTVYLRDGRKINYQMFLSGILLGTNLFVEQQDGIAEQFAPANRGSFTR